VSAARTLSAVPPVESIHRLPKSVLVDRAEYLVRRAAGRSVVDLGFVDAGRMASRLEHGDWLHHRLRRVARSLVGIDADDAGVAKARELGYDAYAADCESEESIRALGVAPAELVIAGELIEHLSCPGAFLGAVAQLVAPGGELVVTTPNATSLTNVVAGMLRREFVNSDHVGWQSWHTARSLLARHGWNVRELAYYRLPRFEASGETAGGHQARMHAFNAYQAVARPLFRLFPSWADGLIVVAAR
jgi:SAM-dependent methyltransferase